MTGEMGMPPNADEGADYWKDKTGTFGYRVLGDESYLIRPNYPEIFELKDKLKKAGLNPEIHPFDVYQGPYLRVANLKIWYPQPEQEVCDKGHCHPVPMEKGWWFVEQPNNRQFGAAKFYEKDLIQMACTEEGGRMEGDRCVKAKFMKLEKGEYAVGKRYKK